MKNFRLTSFRRFAFLTALVALGVTGCSGPKYTAAPPSDKIVYLDMKFKKGFYGGSWFGPEYQAPRMVVAPKLPTAD